MAPQAVSMAHRRQVGYVFRKRRPGVLSPGEKATYHPGWYVRIRRAGKELLRYGGQDRATAMEFLRRLQRDMEQMELLGQTPAIRR